MARCRNKFPPNDMSVSKVRTIINELLITRHGSLQQDIIVIDTTDGQEHDLIIEKTMRKRKLTLRRGQGLTD